jgi:hypothetical protein
MSTFIRSALIAVAVLSSISAASARSHRMLDENGVINSDRNLNSPEAVKEFWDNQQHTGG